jgi:hypothetical protein
MDSSQRKHENNPTELYIAGNTLLSVYLDSGVQVVSTVLLEPKALVYYGM